LRLSLPVRFESLPEGFFQLLEIFIRMTIEQIGKAAHGTLRLCLKSLATERQAHQQPKADYLKGSDRSLIPPTWDSTNAIRFVPVSCHLTISREREASPGSLNRNSGAKHRGRVIARTA
jgi:hypothetical protein